MSRTSQYTAPAAACAARMLAWLARTPGSQSLANIARGTGFTKSLVYRVAQELENADLITRYGSGYRLGLVALELGAAVAEHSDFNEYLKDDVVRLANQVGETVNVGALRDADVLIVLKQEAPDRVVTISHVGQRLPANCSAIGQMLLSTLEDDEVRRRFPEQLPRLTSRSITNVDDLLFAVRRAQKSGYAIDCEGSILGRCAVAVLLQLPQQLDDPLALAVTASTDEFEQRREELLDALLVTRSRVERQLRALDSMVSPDT